MCTMVEWVRDRRVIQFQDRLIQSEKKVDKKSKKIKDSNRLNYKLFPISQAERMQRPHAARVLETHKDNEGLKTTKLGYL